MLSPCPVVDTAPNLFRRFTFDHFNLAKMKIIENLLKFGLNENLVTGCLHSPRNQQVGNHQPFRKNNDKDD